MLIKTKLKQKLNKMKLFTKPRLSLIAIGLLLSISLSCSKEDLDPETPIVIEEPEEPGNSFIAISPDLNDGKIEFETTGPSFEPADELNSTNSNGTWGVFGDNPGKVVLSYSDNPSKSGINTSNRVVKITEPVDVQSWAGFFFNLEKTINFPVGKEAISVHFYSPKPGHNVLLKLEDQLPGDNSEKLSTGDLFAVTTSTGWETLVFNVPLKNQIRNNIYNRLTMIAGYGVSNTEPVNYYIDNIDFSTPKEVIIPDNPTTTASNPTVPENQVISIFSDSYTDVADTNFNPNWGQSTAVSTISIESNDILKYDNLNYQGTEFASALDVSSKTKLHIDYFTGNATTLKFYLISPGPAEKPYELDVETNPGSWNSVDIDLSYFADTVDLTNLVQFKVEGTGIVFFDNIYFHGVNSSPTTAAPDPTLDASDVISIYSDKYTAAVTPNTNPNWGQATVVTELDFSSNKVLKYESLNYQGTDWNETPLDVSTMEYLNFDYWTADASQFNFFIISPGPLEKAYSPDTVVQGQWVTVRVPLSYFSDVVNLTQLIQFKVDNKASGESATIYFDNLYFSK